MKSNKEKMKKKKKEKKEKKKKKEKNINNIHHRWTNLFSIKTALIFMKVTFKM